MKFPLFALLFLRLFSHIFAATYNDTDPDYNPITEDEDYELDEYGEYVDPSTDYGPDAISDEYDDDESEVESRTFKIEESDDEEDGEGSSGSGDGDNDEYDIPEDDRFYCDQKTLILNKNKICDGVADCGDCSDELHCPTSFNKLLSCYNDAPDKERYYLPSRTPYCIPKKNFCNNQPTSCETEVERQNTGFGAKCFVKHQQQSCLLPIQVIMDNMVDCENGADEFKERSSSRAEASLAERTYELGDLEKENMFKCLSDDQIYIFKNQVCDGTLDCPDFSDECLCSVVPARTLQACKSLFPMGSKSKCDCNDPGCSDATCDCSGSELRVKKTATDRHMCVSSGDICDKDFTTKSPELKEMCALTTQQRSEPVGETVDCFMSFDGEGLDPVRAVICDGKPECLHGEDECLPECKKAGVDPAFCKLWNGAGERYKCEVDMVATVCDGKKDCFNGTDELGCPVEEKTARTMTNVERQIQHCSYDSSSNHNQVIRREELLAQGCDVSSRQLWDGTPHCVNGADECPQFFTPGSSESLMQSAGISSYKHAIANSNIKNFISVCGAIGILTNLFAVAMCLVKWRQLFVCHRGDQVDDSAIFTLKLLHEGGFSLSLAASKLCLSGYLFSMVTSTPGDTPYCASDLQWRTGSTCSFLGSLVMLTVPVGVYGAFLMAFVLFIVSSFTSMPTAHRTFCFQFLVSLAFIALLWVPLALMVVIGPSNLNCHAWMSMDGSQLRATGNIVDRDAARGLFSCASSRELGAFSWPGFVDTLHRYAPGYHANLHGTLGYYSHSATCLPLYLATAHPVGGGCPSGNLSTFIVAMLCFLCLSSLTLGILVMRRKLQPLADLALPTVWFAVIESACFFPIACLFFLGITTPPQNSEVTDRVYQSGTLIIIALNATIFTPCLEFVKFFFGHKIAALGGKPKASEHGDDSRILDSPTREKSVDEYDVAGGTTV